MAARRDSPVAARHCTAILPASQAVKRPRKLSTDRARHFCSALGILSELRPRRWRMLDSVEEELGLGWDDAETAANDATGASDRVKDLFITS